ncbi:hypothetical protein KR222_008957 [Zaprionus bogoriensis]|nr:hypothetical protein KR222_008957 [Zaprionus bogoriensis]
MSDPAAQALQMRTSDGILYNVSVQVAQQMGLTHSWLQQERGPTYWAHGDEANDDDDSVDVDVAAGVGIDQQLDDDANVMQLDRVSSQIFQLVLKWCQSAQSLEGLSESVDKDVRATILKGILNEANASDSVIFELIIAADFLHIESLLETGTQHVADLINECESVEAIRKRFNIAYEGDDEDN